MQEKTCACPHCNCQLGKNAVMKDGKGYCCQAAPSIMPMASLVLRRPGASVPSRRTANAGCLL